MTGSIQDLKAKHFMKKFGRFVLIFLAIKSPQLAVSQEDKIKQGNSTTKVETPNANAKDVVWSFYQKIFSKQINGKIPSIAKSKSFETVIRENSETCSQFAKGDLCGWRANFNFIDAQDMEDNLTPAKANLTLTELSPGLIVAKFYVFPSAKKQVEKAQREVKFKMIRENGAWVLDDLFQSNGSARDFLIKETKLLKANSIKSTPQPSNPYFAFDWLSPQTARCEKIDQGQLVKCKEAQRDQAFVPLKTGKYYRCSLSKKSEWLAFESEAICKEQLEAMHANAP